MAASGTGSVSLTGTGATGTGPGLEGVYIDGEHANGQDTQVTTQGKSLQEVLAAAVTAEIPVYLVRTSRGKRLGDVLPDAIWKPAIEATGGRFYAAANESDVIKAVGDIDRRSAGTIAVTQYAVQRPQFRAFAVLAAGLWAVGIVLTATSSPFRKFP